MVDFCLVRPNVLLMAKKLDFRGYLDITSSLQLLSYKENSPFSFWMSSARMGINHLLEFLSNSIAVNTTKSGQGMENVGIFYGLGINQIEYIISCFSERTKLN